MRSFSWLMLLVLTAAGVPTRPSSFLHCWSILFTPVSLSPGSMHSNTSLLDTLAALGHSFSLIHSLSLHATRILFYRFYFSSPVGDSVQYSDIKKLDSGASKKSLHCVCVSQWKKSARRMASTTSNTGDTSSKQQQAQRKENYNKSKRPVSSVDHCHP